MKNDPDEIHFDCPKCKRPMSGDKALLGEMINCPDCNEPFNPVLRKPAPEPAPKPAKPEIRLKCPKCRLFFNFSEKALLDEEFVTCPYCARTFSPIRIRAEQIRARAEDLSAFAGAFLSFGIIALLISVVITLDGKSATVGWLLTAGFLGTAFWLYLIAQVIHIRANTEK